MTFRQNNYRDTDTIEDDYREEYYVFLLCPPNQCNSNVSRIYFSEDYRIRGFRDEIILGLLW